MLKLAKCTFLLLCVLVSCATAIVLPGFTATRSGVTNLPADFALRARRLYHRRNGTGPLNLVNETFNQDESYEPQGSETESESKCTISFGAVQLIDWRDDISAEIKRVCRGEHRLAGRANPSSIHMPAISVTTTAITLYSSNLAYVNKKYIGADEFVQSDAFVIPGTRIFTSPTAYIAFDSIDIHRNAKRVSAVTMDVLPLHPPEWQGGVNKYHVRQIPLAHMEPLVTLETIENGKENATNSGGWKHECIPLETVFHGTQNSSEIIQNSLSKLTKDQLGRLIYTESRQIRDIFDRSIKCGTSEDEMPPGEIDLEAVEIDLCFCWPVENGDQCAHGIYKISIYNFDIVEAIQRMAYFSDSSNCELRNRYIKGRSLPPLALHPIANGLQAVNRIDVNMIPQPSDENVGAATIPKLTEGPTAPAQPTSHYNPETGIPIPNAVATLPPIATRSQTLEPDLIVVLPFHTNQATVIRRPGSIEKTIIFGSSTTTISGSQYGSAGHSMSIGDSEIVVDGFVTYKYPTTASPGQPGIRGSGQNGKEGSVQSGGASVIGSSTLSFANSGNLGYEMLPLSIFGICLYFGVIVFML